MDIINNGKLDLSSDSIWIVSEIYVLMTYVSTYLSNADTSNWLLLLFILIMPHSIVVFTNYVNAETRPTDDAKENIPMPVMDSS
jgi:hypothetical protein